MTLKNLCLTLLLANIYISSGFCKEVKNIKNKAEVKVNKSITSGKLNKAEIAVEVNKDAISYADIEKRSKLILIDTGNSRKGLTPELFDQIKETLIHEKLKKQIAQSLKIFVSPKEIDQHLEAIAKEHNMSLEEMKKFFNSKGVDFQTLKDRVESLTLFSKACEEAFYREIMISDKEVEEELEKLKQDEQKEQFEIAEIVVYFDTPERQSKAKAQADKIYKQLKEGAPFSLMAHNFSESSSSAQGGLIGWLTKEQLPENVAKLNFGHFSEPLLRGNKYVIYYVKDHKLPGQAAASESTIDIAIVKINSPDSNNFEDLVNFSSVSSEIKKCKSCKALKEKAHEYNLDIQEQNNIPITMITSDLKNILDKTPIGQVSDVIRISEAESIMVMPCGKKTQEKKALPTKTELKRILHAKKMEEKALFEFNKFLARATINDKTIQGK